MDKKRCALGERKDPKTGKCEKMSEELIKYRQSLRNKKKGVVFDENNNKVKPMKRVTAKKKPIRLIAINEDEITEEKIQKSIDRTISEDIEPSPEEEKEKEIQTREQESIDSDRTISEDIQPSPEEKEQEQQEKEEEKKAQQEQAKKEQEQAKKAQQEQAKKEQEQAKKAQEQAKEAQEQAKEAQAKKEQEEIKPFIANTTNKNDFLLQKEQAEYDALLQGQGTDSHLYPTLDDPDFSYKIAQRQEFADTKYDGPITNIREQADMLCKTHFELMPHQLFVKNFLSFQTPYNSLLLYHGLGSGKTCSAIGIAEEMRGYMKQMGFTKKIIIVASPNVQDNFRLQLFDERKLELMPDGQWNLSTCIGNTLLQEINPTNLRGFTKEKISSQVRTLINSYYVFMGDKGEFANYIKRVTFIPKDSGLSDKDEEILRTKKIKSHFNNRLVIIDEIHNIRISDANKNKLTSVLLNEIAKKSDSMRLLLLSATPMYNSYNEIIWLANVLNANDKRGLIKIDDVFQSNGTFTEKGKDLLVRKLTGYISYVRGENPYIFPYRIYPSTFDEEHVISAQDYPSVQMNQIAITDPLRFVPVYKNDIGSYQYDGYQFIMTYLGLKSNQITDKRGKTRIMPSFENMESFGYTLLLAPLESLIMVYPNPKLDEMLEKKRLLKAKAKGEVEVEEPDIFDQEENREIIKSIIGKTGLSNIMKYKTTNEPVPKRFDFEYKPTILKKYNEIFSPEHIHKYSAKISNICNIIKKPSTGIIIIYSQYIDGGVIPMALALESMGFSRYASTSAHNNNLLKTKKESIDSVTMKSKSQVPASDFKPAKYVIITGDKDFSQNNNDDIKYVTNKENTHGELVKVILISKAASEGLDFKNIRQVHILEPWYNMNRIEQIIGRGVRNASHCSLPFEERNVEIYLHGTILDKDEEAADLYVYRSAEKKAVQIGQVTRLLKEVAVDCQLNIAQTNFTEAKLLEITENQHVKINVSSGKTVEFKIGDKPFTDICDYMDNCSFQCRKRDTLPELTSEAIIKTTYEDNFIKNNSMIIMKKIRDLFLEKTVYKREHLVNAINQVKKYPIEHIYYALTRFINTKTEELMDKYGRSGYLVSRDEYYAFQPNEIMDESASIFERSVPVDYKNVSLKIELPKEMIQKGDKTQTQTQTQTQNQGVNKKDVPLELTRQTSVSRQTSISSSYENILKRITDIMKLIFDKIMPKKASDKNWYKHVNMVTNDLLQVHEIPPELINKYIIYHFLDYLTMQEKLMIVQYIYSNILNTGYEIIFKLYFDNLMLENDEKTKGILLANNGTNILFIQNESEWIEAGFTDQASFKSSRISSFMIPVERINTTEIGFMHPFKGKDMSFKIKDMTQKRNNKGAKCEDASKPVIAEKIGIVLNERGIYSETMIEKPDLCVILEILMRWITEKNSIQNPKGPVLFFGPEQSNEMNITNMRIV